MAIIDQKQFKNAVVQWPAVNESSLGPLASFRLEVPPQVSGRLDIYLVPKCEAYPEGYWFALNTEGTRNTVVEPGCAAWEKTLLMQIRFSAAPTVDDDDMHTGGRMDNVVEFKHEEVPFNDSMLNPNDYSKFVKQPENSEGGK